MTNGQPTQLGSIITDPKARAITYRVGALVGIAAGGITVAFGVIGEGLPVWVNVMNAVLAFLGAAGLGGLATANTPRAGGGLGQSVDDAPTSDPEAEELPQ